MALNVDIVPTLLDYVGINIPADMQGKSLKGLLEDDKATQEYWRKSAYYHYFEYPKWHNVQPHYGVRTARYKLIHFYYNIDTWEFYELEKDPNELMNQYKNPIYQEEIVKLKILLILTVGYLSLIALDTVAQDRPNILFIMSDDHTAQAISAYQGILSTVFQTPNIDRIANEGARLDNCFVTNSISTPSRAAIITGQYSQKNGVYTLNDALDPAAPNAAKYMQASGYQTAIVGKWHLHAEHSNNIKDVLPGGAHSFWSMRVSWANVCHTPFIVSWPKVIKANTLTDQPGHIVDIFPTILDLIQDTYPKQLSGVATIPLHGHSLSPIFKGEKRETPPYFISGCNEAFRMYREKNNKIVRYKNGKWQLYDLEKDPTEIHDLADKNPFLVKEMNDRYTKIRKTWK